MMAYENMRLVLAGISGEVYLSTIKKDGSMSERRREMTDECRRATAEWFMHNEKKMVSYQDKGDGRKPTLFFTDDADKAARILAILQEDEDL